jgi:DNA processing protein
MNPGRLPDLIVGVVGSRKASSFGLSFARRLGATLARKNASVCSGLALGIDGAVHRGVLEEIARNPKAAPPVGVLGHGWGAIHPPSHEELAKEVERTGSLLTEYQPGAPPTRWTFPARNRIIAALSDHVVVVEAGSRSGSLYTAEFAEQLGRTVWIVPNAPGRPNSAGVLGLWKAGAQTIIDLDEFAETVAPSKVENERSSEALPPSLNSPENREILAHLARCDGSLDDICESEKWTPTELACRVTELELDGVVRRMIDGRWTILRWDLAGHLSQEVTD